MNDPGAAPILASATSRRGLASDFEIRSSPGKGTTVIARQWLS
jgi:hypothetical protein